MSLLPPRNKKAKSRLIYLVLVAAAFVAHSCALEADEATEAGTAAVISRTM